MKDRFDSNQSLKQKLKRIEHVIDTVSDFIYSNTPATEHFMKIIVNLMMSQLHIVMEYRSYLYELLEGD